MSVTVKVNGVANSLVHKGSSGVSVATLPDVCKTPSPGGPVPMPYPNISQSVSLKKGTKTVKADGGNMIAIKGSEFSLSNGDNAGTVGGIKSNTFMKESTWILYSFDVKMNGKNACRLTDKKFQNHQNTVDAAGTFQKPVNLSPADSQLWDDCEEQHDKYKDVQDEDSKLTDVSLKMRAYSGGQPQDIADYCGLLEKRIEVMKRHHKERKKYVDMDCDKFNWNNDSSTPASRKAAHVDVLNKIHIRIQKAYQELRGFQI
jgi:hypothetical protein